ncbi:phosphotransferase [Streptomyces albulus]|nr:phosphotransferase [Streptomyces noursei]
MAARRGRRCVSGRPFDAHDAHASKPHPSGTHHGLGSARRTCVRIRRALHTGKTRGWIDAAAARFRARPGSGASGVRRALPSGGAAGLRGDGRGPSGPVLLRAVARDQGHPRRLRPRPGVPRPVPAGGGRRPTGQRRLHRARRRCRPGRRAPLDGDPPHRRPDPRRTRQAERPADPGEVRRLGAGLAEALRDIHRAGVVHRDLKPGNVLLAADGPKVIDFGISRPSDSEMRTETGKLIGTPPFMAPSSSSARARSAPPRTSSRSARCWCTPPPAAARSTPRARTSSPTRWCTTRPTCRTCRTRSCR